MVRHLGNKIMNRTPLSLFAILVIGIGSLNVPLASQAERGVRLLTN
jgi:hypothetical protein